MESWIQDLRALAQLWTAISIEPGKIWTQHDKIRRVLSERAAGGRVRVDWRRVGIDCPPLGMQIIKQGHLRKEVCADGPAAEGRQAPANAKRQEEAGAVPPLTWPRATAGSAPSGSAGLLTPTTAKGCTESAVRGDLLEVHYRCNLIFRYFGANLSSEGLSCGEPFSAALNAAARA